MAFYIKIYENRIGMVEEEAYNYGSFDTESEAMEEAVETVLDFFFDDQYEGKSLAEMKELWAKEGETPVIVSKDKKPAPPFSAKEFVDKLTEKKLEKYSENR